MLWASLVIVLLSSAQFACGRELIHTGKAAYLVTRNSLPRNVVDAFQEQNDEPSEGAFNRPIFYKEELRPSSDTSASFFHPSSAEELRNSFLSDNGKLVVHEKEDPLIVVRDREEGQPLEEQSIASADLSEQLSEAASDRSEPRFMDNLNSEERFFIRKRLQMKGMGLLGNMKGQHQSLIGLSKSQPKGLVLSIDLGIKALRDAIMHAKVQQKNKLHHVQAQKNMRLLHNIGKRRADSTPSRSRA